jgi:hypothetical protein
MLVNISDAFPLDTLISRPQILKNPHDIYPDTGGLGVTLIPAYSPEARGRSERAFRTLQDRLPNELAWAGITEMAAANRFLTEQFLPQYNDRFMVRATEPGTAFIPWIGTPHAEILCVQEERVVAKDNTVHYHRQRLQIPQAPHRFHDVKVTVRVHAYPDGTLAVFHGPRCLARYYADRRLIETGRARLARNGPTHGSDVSPIVHPRPTVRDRISARG